MEVASSVNGSHASRVFKTSRVAIRQRRAIKTRAELGAIFLRRVGWIREGEGWSEVGGNPLGPGQGEVRLTYFNTHSNDLW